MPYKDPEKAKEASRKSAARRRLRFPEKCRGKLVKELAAEELQRRRAQKRKAQARYAAAHPEKVKVMKAKWAIENPEKVRAISAGVRARRKDVKKARYAMYRAANLERVRQQKRDTAMRYAIAHPDRVVRNDLKQNNGITDPPPELVEAIVTIRRVKRLLKEKQKCVM